MFFLGVAQAFGGVVEAVAAAVAPAEVGVPVGTPDLSVAVFVGVFFVFRLHAEETFGIIIPNSSSRVIHRCHLHHNSLIFNLRLQTVLQLFRNFQMLVAPILANEFLHFLVFEHFFFLSELTVHDFYLTWHCNVVNFHSTHLGSI